MTSNYLQLIASQLGVSLWLLAVIFVWSAIWKLVALWKSARKGHMTWFIILAIVNTIGILEILYIFVFSKIGPMKSTPKKKSSRKRR
jgi:hypothetical protein